jgi:hypothetical protein
MRGEAGAMRGEAPPDAGRRSARWAGTPAPDATSIRHSAILGHMPNRDPRREAGPPRTSPRDRDPGTAGEMLGRPIGRRTVLGLLGLSGAGILVGSQVQAGISRVLGGLRGGLLASVVPGSGGFILYTVTSGYPAPPPGYRLQVEGMVRQPLNLTVDDLKSLPATHLTDKFQCVTGWQVDNVHWVGVRLTDLADRSGVLPGATAFEFRSFDGVYTESLTLEQARQTGAIAAYSMLGGPVSQEHGGPVRLFVPGMFGYKSIKWLSSISLVRSATPGFWEQNGYPLDAWIDGHPPPAAAQA